MKLKNADWEQLNPFANCRYANVLIAEFNASSSIDCWSTI